MIYHCHMRKNGLKGLVVVTALNGDDDDNSPRVFAAARDFVSRLDGGWELAEDMSNNRRSRETWEFLARRPSAIEIMRQACDTTR